MFSFPCSQPTCGIDPDTLDIGRKKRDKEERAAEEKAKRIANGDGSEDEGEPAGDLLDDKDKDGTLLLSVAFSCYGGTDVVGNDCSHLFLIGSTRP